jgi:predicted nucleic acid-binding protein
LDVAFEDISNLSLVIDAATSESPARLGALALLHGLACYDAAYLDLGIRTGFPIATLDKALIRAMQAANVERVKPQSK